MLRNNSFRSGKTSKINMSSMTDVAFLVIIFFWVATSIPTEKGIAMTLPRYAPKIDKDIIRCGSRLTVYILVNSQNKILMNGEETSISKIKEKTIKYIVNSDKNLRGSSRAVFSLKGDRGVSFGVYMQVLDQVKATYTSVRAKEIGWSEEKMLHFPANQENATQEEIIAYNKVVFLYPMVISEADAW